MIKIDTRKNRPKYRNSKHLGAEHRETKFQKTNTIKSKITGRPNTGIADVVGSAHSPADSSFGQTEWRELWS